MAVIFIKSIVIGHHLPCLNCLHRQMSKAGFTLCAKLSGTRLFRFVVRALELNQYGEPFSFHKTTVAPRTIFCVKWKSSLVPRNGAAMRKLRIIWYTFFRFG